mgnify:CR=1 FL=1
MNLNHVPDFNNEADYLASLKDECRFCKQPDCDSFVAPYWQFFIETKAGFVKPKARCHKACKGEGVKAEAYECQNIDRDCNDCKHFTREAYLGNSIFSGECGKFNKPVKAYPNYCSNHECFEHRKD